MGGRVVFVYNNAKLCHQCRISSEFANGYWKENMRTQILDCKWNHNFINTGIAME